MSGTFGGGGDDNGGFLSGLINTLGNPETFGMLSGLTRGAAMAAMPSRMPIPTGAALGLAASGLQEGRNQALQGQLVKQQGIASQLGNIGTSAQLPVLLSRAHMLQQIYSDPNLMGLVRQGLGGSSAPMGVPSMGQSPSLQMSPSVATPVPGGSQPSSASTMPSGSSPAAGWSLLSALPADQQKMIQAASQQTGMPVDLLANHKWNESRTTLTPAEGDGGASFGVMQMKGPTLDSYNQAHGTNYTVQQLKADPQLALNVGAGHWMDLKQQYGSPFLASMAYARGPGATDQWLKSGADFGQLPQGVREVLGNVYGPGSFPGSAPIEPALFAVRSQTPGAVGPPIGQVAQAGSQSVTPQNAMETAQQYEQQANRLELLKGLGLPAMGDPATLRSAAQQFRGVALAGPTEQAKAAVGLQYAGPMALAKAQNSPIELRIGGMAGMPTGNGNFNWIKNPELRTITTPTGAKQDVYMSPPLPGSAPGTLGTAEPVVGPGGQQAMSELPPQVTQGREHVVNDFQTKGMESYIAAQNTQAWLNQIDSAADAMNKAGPAYMTGPFAPQRLGLVSGANDLLRSFKVDPKVLFDQPAIAGWEEMKKATTTAGFELSSHYEGHARQAAATIMNATSAVPGMQNSPMGQKLVSAGIREGAQSAIDSHEYDQTVYNATQGAGLESSTVDFYKAHPPQQYANRAISVLHPFSVSKPEDMAKYLPGTFVTIPKISPTTGKPMVVQVPQRQETINGFPVTLSVPSYLQQQAQGGAPNASP